MSSKKAVYNTSGQDGYLFNLAQNTQILHFRKDLMEGYIDNGI